MDRAGFQALNAEERAAAVAPTPEAYVALLKRRLGGRPIILDLDLLERTIAERPWADALLETAGPLLVYTTTRPETVVFVNTFPRVPTAAAETVLIEQLGLRRDTLHTPNGGHDQGFDRLTAIRAFRPRSLVRGHVVGWVRVRAFLDLLGIRPILLVRDIFDTIASYASDQGYPAILPGHRLGAVDPERRRRILTLRMAPNLVNFYASWSAVHAAGRGTLWRWEDVRHDWPGFVVDRLAEHGRSVDRQLVADRFASLPRDPHSEPGRGAILSDDDKALVRLLYAQYPGVDFRPIDADAPVPI